MCKWIACGRLYYLNPKLVLYWHTTYTLKRLTFKFSASSLETPELLFFPPHPQPRLFIFTVRVKHITSNPSRSCSRLSCVPYRKIIERRSSRGVWQIWQDGATSKTIGGCFRGLDLSLSQLILCGPSLLGSWLCYRSALGLTFNKFIYDVRELQMHHESTTIW